MEQRENKLMVNVKRFFMKNVAKNIPLLGLVLLMVILSFNSSQFLTSYNLLSIIRQASINGLIAFGMMTVILSSGIDLSVGSTLAFTSLIMAKMIHAGFSSPIAIGIAILLGAMVGVINGLLISKGKLQPMIATLSTMMVFRGVTLYVSNGVPESKLGEGLIGWLGRGSVAGVPVPVYILVIVFAIFFFMLNRTVFGKRVYAIGGNVKAARLSGIHVERNQIYVYMISGILATLAGIILTSRIDSAVPTAGASYEMNAIAACVIGGASLTGGRGKVTGTLIGIMIIAVLMNGLNMMGTSAYLQQIITGLIIIAAVIFDRKK